MTLHKHATAMTVVEEQLYVNVIGKLNQDGTYRRPVSHHASMKHNMHGGMGPIGRQRFLS